MPLIDMLRYFCQSSAVDFEVQSNGYIGVCGCRLLSIAAEEEQLYSLHPAPHIDIGGSGGWDVRMEIQADMDGYARIDRHNHVPPPGAQQFDYAVGYPCHGIAAAADD